MQGNYADPKTTETPDLELHQFDRAELKPERQNSACRTNQSTARKTSLLEHPPNVLQCQHCDYTTAHFDNLITHSRKHIGERFQCQYCDYRTAYQADLKCHSRKHTGDMFQCQHCDFTTAYSSSL